MCSCVYVHVCALMPWEILIQMFSCRYVSTRRLNVFVHLECFRNTFFTYYLTIRVCMFMYARVCIGVWNMFVLVCVFVCAYVHVCVHVCMYARVFV